MPGLTRRSAILTLSGAILAVPTMSRGVLGQTDDISKEMIFNDPAAPVGGNLKGDLTIVNFTDYNCPFCKKVASILVRVIKEDGNIRHVYKDWPVIRPTSIDGAQLAIAAKYQGKYEIAHDALMRLPGSRVLREQMRAGLQSAGIDMQRLDADLVSRRDDILSLVKRNMVQADSIGLTGTPSFLVGPYRTSTLDYAGFKQIVADARAKQAQTQ